MELLTDTKLIKGDKSEVEVADALAGIEVIGFYFSAHWCPPCCAFTPVLAKAYAEAKKENLPVEVIFVTNDGSEEDMFAYMAELHGDWLALPFGSEPIKQLDTKYEINGIPTLVVVKKDGSLLTDDGREHIESNGVKAFKEWLK